MPEVGVVREGNGLQDQRVVAGCYVQELTWEGLDVRKDNKPFAIFEGAEGQEPLVGVNDAQVYCWLGGELAALEYLGGQGFLEYCLSDCQCGLVLIERHFDQFEYVY